MGCLHEERHSGSLDYTRTMRIVLPWMQGGANAQAFTGETTGSA